MQDPLYSSPAPCILRFEMVQTFGKWSRNKLRSTNNFAFSLFSPILILVWLEFSKKLNFYQNIKMKMNQISMEHGWKIY